MLHVNTMTSINRYDELTDFFNRGRSPVFINVNKVKAYYGYSVQVLTQLNKEINIILEAHTGKPEFLNPNSPGSVAQAMIMKCGIPAKFLKNKEGNTSVNAKVLDRLPSIYAEMAFVKAYRQYAAAEAIRSNMSSYVGVKPVEGLYNNEGEPLGMIFPRYTQHKTYRYNSFGYNVQGMNKLACDIISAPEGYVVLSIDSKQIEPLIYISTIYKDPMLTYLVDAHGDAYYGMADFALRSNAVLSEDNKGLISREEIISHVGSRDTLKTFLSASNYGSSQNYLIHLGGEILGDAVYKRLVLHPNRQEYKKQNAIRISKGERVISSHFGDTVRQNGSFNHLENCFINNPIQMDVARLSSYSVLESVKFIEENNLTEDGVLYSFHKHDEDTFIIHRDHVHLAETFRGFREYQVDDWLPVSAEASISLNYSK